MRFVVNRRAGYVLKTRTGQKPGQPGGIVDAPTARRVLQGFGSVVVTEPKPFSGMTGKRETVRGQPARKFVS